MNEPDSRRLPALRAILAFSVLPLGAHFTHHFVQIDQHPGDLVSGGVVRVAILVAWPLLTLAALYAYRLYRDGRLPTAHGLLLGYAVLGLTTPGHFLDGTPDIAPFWMATVFTDALAGLLVVTFVAWSARGRHTAAPA